MVQVTITGSTLRRVFGWLLLMLAVIGLVCLVALALRGFTETSGGGAGGGHAAVAAVVDRVDRKRYQAVFLTNDRVYFGRLRDAGGGWFELRDAHYIREAAKDAKEVAPITEELTGPRPHLLVNPDEVVQVQELSRDSKVAAAIDRLGE